MDLIFHDSIFDPMEDAVDDVAFLADTIFTTEDDVWSFGFYSEDIGAVYSENAVSRAIHFTTDGGQTWVTKTAPDNSRVRDIEFSTATVLFAASDNGVFRSEDQGDSWVSLSSFTGSDDVTLFETTSFIMESQFSIDGLDWEEYSIDGTGIDSWRSGTLDAATFFNEDIAFAFFRDIGNGNMFLGQTNNGGAAWTLKSQPLNRSVRSISFVNEEVGFAVGDFDGLVSTKDGGTTWQVADEGTDAYFVHVNDDLGFVLFQFATFSIDGGETWEPIMDMENDVPISWSVGSGASGQGMGNIVFVTDGANGGNVVKFDLEQFQDN
ncbi:MAG: YCF48-related protein [Bacteroidota bacterium]